MKRLLAVGLTVLTLSLSAVVPAFADDHLFNATNSNGVDNRGFANPVAANPSGTSGPAAQPGTVPGTGDPKVGQEQGTPSVSVPDLNPTAAAHVPFAP